MRTAGKKTEEKDTMPEFYLKNIQAVIFDAEGVVVDTETVWDAVQREFLGRRGLEYDRDTLKPLMAGRPGEQAVGVLKRTFRSAGPCTRPCWPNGTPSLPICLVVKSGSLKVSRNFSDRRNRPGCVPPWRTSMSRAMLARADAALGIVKMFGSRIVTGDDVRRGKPSPDIYLQAAALADARTGKLSGS